MSRTKRQKKIKRQHQRERRHHHASPTEVRSSEAITILWMLTATATLAALIVSTAARLVGRFVYENDLPPAVRILSGWFLFCAIVTGIVCLILTPIVYRFRQVKPPPAITIGAIAIGVAPLVTMLYLSWQS